METSKYSEFRDLVLHEKIPLRLQKDIEIELVTLEKERKESIRLEQLIKDAQEELLETQSRSQRSLDTKEILSKIAISDKKLEISSVQLQEILNDNFLLRNQVDSLRQDLLTLEKVIETTETDIKDCAKRSQMRASKTNELLDIEEKDRQKLLLMRTKSVTARDKFNHKISGLASVIQMEEQHKSQTLRNLKESLNIQMFRPLNMLDNTKVVNYLIPKLGEQIVAKKKELTEYLDRINELKNAFYTLTVSTGLDSYQEIVTLFLKSEDQRADITKYLNELIAESDSLMRSLGLMEFMCKINSMSNEKRLYTVNSLSENLDYRLKRVIESNKNAVDKVGEIEFRLFQALGTIKVKSK